MALVRAASERLGVWVEKDVCLSSSAWEAEHSKQGGRGTAGVAADLCDRLMANGSGACCTGVSRQRGFTGVAE